MVSCNELTPQTKITDEGQCRLEASYWDESRVMTLCRLTTDSAKNYCNQTLTVQVILENVVTFFFWDTVVLLLRWWLRSLTTLPILCYVTLFVIDAGRLLLFWRQYLINSAKCNSNHVILITGEQVDTQSTDNAWIITEHVLGLLATIAGIMFCGVYYQQKLLARGFI